MHYSDYVVIVAPEGAVYRAIFLEPIRKSIICEDTEQPYFQTMTCQTEELAQLHAKAAIDAGMLTTT